MSSAQLKKTCLDFCGGMGGEMYLNKGGGQKTPEPQVIAKYLYSAQVIALLKNFNLEFRLVLVYTGHT